MRMRGMPRTALALLNRPSARTPEHEPGAADIRMVDPTLPHLSVLDLAATRGDGVFESIGVADGVAHAVEAHLRRFAASAAKLDLPEPDLDVWRRGIEAVTAELDPRGEFLIKAVLSRGIEGDGRPTGWLHGFPASDYTDARENGIRVVMLDRGFRHDVEQTSPWLLAGAKTLSYAVNRAVLREAARRGAEDVIFVSSDGFILEGPTSSVVFRRGNAILTPGTGLGILEGTTQGDIFTWAEANGYETGFEQITPQQLTRVDAIWLVSSGRQAAQVIELDGLARPRDRELTAAINDYLVGRAG